MTTWSVPFITETVELYHIEAKTKGEAVMLATIKRQRYMDALVITAEEHESDAPDHSHISKFTLGTIAKAVADPDEEHAGAEAAT